MEQPGQQLLTATRSVWNGGKLLPNTMHPLFFSKSTNKQKTSLNTLLSMVRGQAFHNLITDIHLIF